MDRTCVSVHRQRLRNQRQAPTNRKNQLRINEYNASDVDASWVRTIKVNQKLHRRRANRHLASPFGIIFVDERFTLTFGKLRGDEGELFNDCVFTKSITVSLEGHEVLPVLVLGYDGGANGLREIEDALGGSVGSTFMQRNGNASSSVNRNGCGVDNECDKCEQSGFRKHGEWEDGKRGRRGEMLWNQSTETADRRERWI